MDLHTFNREFTEDFIALYKSLPCLWDPRHKDYMDRKKKHNAYEKLATLQRQVNPTASKETVVKKINSLRTTYRRARRKVIAVKQQKNEIYSPNLWYFDLLKFLNEGQSGGKPVSNNEEDDEDCGETEALNEEYLDEYRPLSAVKIEHDSSNLYQRSSPKKVCKRLSDSPQFDQAEDYKEPLGRFVHFGRYIAEELERLPDDMAVYCQKLINDTLFEAQTGKLNSKSRIINTEGGTIVITRKPKI